MDTLGKFAILMAVSFVTGFIRSALRDRMGIEPNIPYDIICLFNGAILGALTVWMVL